MTNENQKKEEEFEEIEEKLLEEEAREREQTMIVSGKSVFEIKRIKNKDLEKE